MPIVTITNSADPKGLRGFHAESGYVELAPGQTVEDVEISAAELKSAEGTGYFTFGEVSDDAAPADDLDRSVPGAPAGDGLDDLSDEVLLDTVKALGKTPPDGASREELLALARAEG